VKTTNSSSAQ